MIVGFPNDILVYGDKTTINNIGTITGDIGIFASGITGLNISQVNITLPNTGLKLGGVINSNIQDTWIRAGQYAIY